MTPVLQVSQSPDAQLGAVQISAVQILACRCVRGGEGREGEAEGDIQIKSNLFITVGGHI